MSTERRPRGRGWREDIVPPSVRESALSASAWRRAGVLAVSSLIDAELPDGAGVGPQWHVSISDRGRRPTDAAVRRVLRAFRLDGAEEDNHHPGIARHFFRPLDRAHRVDCECKDNELIITEADGYRWTTPVGSRERPEICRGCALERMTGRSCSLHPRASRST